VDSAGNVTPYAGDGNGTGDPRYDNVPAAKARFYQPTSLLADASGNVFVADTHNCAIRRIGNDSQHMVTTLAGGLFTCDYRDGTGTDARFFDPMGLSWKDGHTILIADSANHAIRALDTGTAVVTTVAVTNWGDELDGPLDVAVFYYPTAVTTSNDGRIFFVTSSTGELKMLSAGVITTLVAGGMGYADGYGNSARMLPQGGLVWDGASLIVADTGNQRLRRVVPGTNPGSTFVTTFAGSGRVGGLDGAASSAQFGLPLGLYRDTAGNIYVADGTGSIRVVRP
jgi:sugar lactone lactonase YvrE